MNQILDNTSSAITYCDKPKQDNTLLNLRPTNRQLTRHQYTRSHFVHSICNHIKAIKNLKFSLWVVVVCAALLFPFTSSAKMIELSSGIYTNHLEEHNTERNEDNDLIAFNYRFTDSDWGLLGANFTNSYNIKTNALAVTYSVVKYLSVEVELVFGLMKGYTEWELHDKLCPFGENSEICLLIAPKISVELFNHNGIAPKVSALLMGEAIIVTVGVGYEF